MMLAFLFLLAPPSWGQAPQKGAGQPADDSGAYRADREPARREAVRFMVLQRMREALELTDAQSLKVIDAMRQLDSERESHRKAHAQILTRLRELLDSSATDGQLLEQVELFKKETARFEAKVQELEQRLMEPMNPRQRASFLILRRDLMREYLGAGGPGEGAGKRARGRGRPG